MAKTMNEASSDRRVFARSLTCVAAAVLVASVVVFTVSAPEARAAEGQEVGSFELTVGTDVAYDAATLRVSNTAGERLPQASVAIDGKGAFVADSNGEVALDKLAVGTTYHVRAEHEGHESAAKDFKFEGASAEVWDMALAPKVQPGPAPDPNPLPDPKPVPNPFGNGGLTLTGDPLADVFVLLGALALLGALVLFLAGRRRWNSDEANPNSQ